MLLQGSDKSPLLTQEISHGLFLPQVAPLPIRTDLPEGFTMLSSMHHPISVPTGFSGFPSK